MEENILPKFILDVWWLISANLDFWANIHQMNETGVENGSTHVKKYGGKK